jgi:glyoxylase-like metal-dependent hydrolase (beta-lactamase superfamily II)
MTGRHLGRRELVAGAAFLGLVTWAGEAEGAGSRPMSIRRTRTVSRRVGGLEVVALLDASGSFGSSWEEVFPDADACDWELARRADPRAFGADGTWHLDFHCFAIRRPDDKVVLVDVGVGPEGSPASSWAPVPGRLPDALRDAGIKADDVVAVVMTHLHEDHLGWAVLPDGTPLFPDARYVVQRREIRHLAQQPDRTIWEYAVAPLLRAGQLEQVDGRTRLPVGPGRRGAEAIAIPTPGHTVGHQSVIVSDPYDEVVVTGDVLVHAVQLVNPEVAYEFEQDPERARRTRQRLLARAERRRTVLATAHLTRPFVRT